MVAQYLTLSPKLLKQISAKWTKSLLQQPSTQLSKSHWSLNSNFWTMLMQENSSVSRTIHLRSDKLPNSLALHITWLKKKEQWIYWIRGLSQPPYLSCSSCGKSWWWIVTNGSIPGLSMPCPDLGIAKENLILLLIKKNCYLLQKLLHKEIWWKRGNQSNLPLMKIKPSLEILVTMTILLNINIKPFMRFQSRDLVFTCWES